MGGGPPTPGGAQQQQTVDSRGWTRSARPHNPRGRAARRQALVAAVTAVLVAVTASVVLRPDPEPVTANVTAAPGASSDADLSGSWPTTTTEPPPTTTTLDAAPADDGLAIAPPLSRPWANSYVVADALVPEVPLFAEPGVPVPSGRVMTNPTWEGLDLVFLVRHRGTNWHRVQIMSRPNGALAWIRASDVALRRAPNHIVIERGAKRLTVLKGEEVVFQTSVATGKASSPTPLGTFFVDGIRWLRPAHRSYGVGQVSFSGFSEVHHRFGGGVGQVAMHGTQNPALIGTPASNGCVRMHNDDITRLFDLAPTGTPVEVVA